MRAFYHRWHEGISVLQHLVLQDTAPTPSRRVCCFQDRAKTIYLYPPPGELVWSGIHHIWGRPTSISSPGPCSMVNVIVGLGGKMLFLFSGSPEHQWPPNCVVGHIVSCDAYLSVRLCYDAM